MRRVLIQTIPGGFRFVMQRRVLRLFWRATRRSTVYADMGDLLLDLASLYTQAAIKTHGVHVKRRARRQFGKLAGRLAVR